jgi:diguanylate cyclase (GGDEF)-like protein
MKLKANNKTKFLNPKIRKRIEDLFKEMNESVEILYEAATRDEKTGLYNHRFFKTQFEIELEKAERGKQKLSLIIIDIDFFKKINDTYGHIKADDLLKRLAEVLVEITRKYDIVARFGGEEFLILLPETNLEKAKRFAARLKKAVHEDKILKKHKLTVSGGITQYAGKKDSNKKMKIRVDKALYKAKQTGRDKFVSLK